jgi:hypothetical protein
MSEPEDQRYLECVVVLSWIADLVGPCAAHPERIVNWPSLAAAVAGSGPATRGPFPRTARKGSQLEGLRRKHWRGDAGGGGGGGGAARRV